MYGVAYTMEIGNYIIPNIPKSFINNNDYLVTTRVIKIYILHVYICCEV